jgi:hypothetical protein
LERICAAAPPEGPASSPTLPARRSAARSSTSTWAAVEAALTTGEAASTTCKSAGAAIGPAQSSAESIGRLNARRFEFTASKGIEPIAQLPSVQARCVSGHRDDARDGAGGETRRKEPSRGIGIVDGCRRGLHRAGGIGLHDL